MLLFEDSGADILCDENFLELAAANDYCFVENRALALYVDRIDELVIYHWNRKYPTDTFFDIDLKKSGFILVSAEDFAGYSHDKITKEIFKK
jgi:hypothetical protein